jgi:uncharacterized UBP type Zn finger protein
MRRCLDFQYHQGHFLIFLDFNEPLPNPSAGKKTRQIAVSEESLAMLMSMGFTTDQATKALRMTVRNYTHNTTQHNSTTQHNNTIQHSTTQHNNTTQQHNNTTQHNSTTTQHNSTTQHNNNLLYRPRTTIADFFPYKYR